MSNLRNNPAASRFEMTSGGGTAFVEYWRAGRESGGAPPSSATCSATTRG